MCQIDLISYGLMLLSRMTVLQAASLKTGRTCTHCVLTLFYYKKLLIIIVLLVVGINDKH